MCLFDVFECFPLSFLAPSIYCAPDSLRTAHMYAQTVQKLIDAGAHPDDEKDQVSFSVVSVAVAVRSDQSHDVGQVLCWLACASVCRLHWLE